jgi:hypothetical protein
MISFVLNFYSSSILKKSKPIEETMDIGFEIAGFKLSCKLFLSAEIN